MIMAANKIVLPRFSHLVRTIRFASKNVTATRLVSLWLVVLICGCFGSFWSFSSTVLAQLSCQLLWLICLPPADVAAANGARQPKAAPASYTRFSCDHQNERSITDQQRKCQNRAKPRLLLQLLMIGSVYSPSRYSTAAVGVHSTGEICMLMQRSECGKESRRWQDATACRPPHYRRLKP